MSRVPASRVAAVAVTALTVIACARQPAAVSPADDVARLLDDWHLAASRADLEGYLGPMAPGGVFLGTDGSERWTAKEFREFVAPWFERGQGWTYTPTKRHVSVAPDGRTAWFDERLDSDDYGELRGSGVLVLADGGWELVQYNMSFVLPNGITRPVVRMVRSAASTPAPASLPAGTWFTTVTYRSVCDGCPAPRFAVIAGIFADRADCGAALRRLESVPLQVGYPLVIHTDELAPVDEDLEGIVIVLALVESEGEGAAWLEAVGPGVGAARIIGLLDRDAAYDRAYRSVEGGEDGELVQARVVRIQAGPPVPAYLEAELDALEEARDAAGSAMPKPVCEVAGGDFFVIEDRRFNFRYYSHAMVACPDGTPALVDWRSTLLDTALVPDADGRGIMRQVVGAECDSPVIESWYYDDRGRYRGPELHQ
jgi:ketosteroid isomerase-like protein